MNQTHTAAVHSHQVLRAHDVQDPVLLDATPVRNHICNTVTATVAHVAAPEGLMSRLAYTGSANRRLHRPSTSLLKMISAYSFGLWRHDVSTSAAACGGVTGGGHRQGRTWRAVSVAMNP